MERAFILGIETSCDETSASVVADGRQVLSNIISSQVKLHEQYGGVVPEIASRRHVELVLPVINQALEKAGVNLSDIDAIGVTYGPGLVGALLVGISAAKGIAFATGKPLIGVNHIHGHIAANYLQHKDLEPPFVCLVVSGGHSHIVYVRDYCEFEILGRTRDDAAGEAFDKIARTLGLDYPGGPVIDKVSRNGNEEAFDFPRVVFDDGSLDFSFSGIKTAVLNFVNTMQQKGGKWRVEDVAASFQKAVVDVLVNNAITAAENTNSKIITIAGGVAANSRLRSLMKEKAEKKNIKVLYPDPVLCTDNAAMIACAAYYYYKKGIVSDFSLNAIPGLKIDE